MSEQVSSANGTRTLFVGGNWKMNGSKGFAGELAGDLKAATLEVETEVVIFPPALYAGQVAEAVGERIQVGLQNCAHVQSGAFTGELSPSMVKDSGFEWVLIGHSERRHVFGESQELLNQKVALALETGLKLIYCIGETEEERENGATESVLQAQMDGLVSSVASEEGWANVVVAYEPVWAIGTGKVATPEQAGETHAMLREYLNAQVSAKVAFDTRILYGGSVKPDNSEDLIAMPHIDGFLVGGASLKLEPFVDIVNSTAKSQGFDWSV